LSNRTIGKVFIFGNTILSCDKMQRATSTTSIPELRKLARNQTNLQNGSQTAALSPKKIAANKQRLETAKKNVEIFTTANEGSLPTHSEFQKIARTFYMYMLRHGNRFEQMMEALGYYVSPSKVIKPDGYWNTKEGIAEARGKLRAFNTRNKRAPNGRELSIVLGSFIPAHLRKGLNRDEIRELVYYPTGYPKAESKLRENQNI
jgi:hypothetical protein